MRVLFVGQNPSKKNLKTEQPFIGTLSHRKLLEWIEELGINEYTLINVSNRLDFKRPTVQELLILDHKAFKADVVVALGKVAANALTSLCIEHIALPHPSPRNRQLNDKAHIATLLKDARTLISSL